MLHDRRLFGYTSQSPCGVVVFVVLFLFIFILRRFPQGLTVISRMLSGNESVSNDGRSTAPQPGDASEVGVCGPSNT